MVEEEKIQIQVCCSKCNGRLLDIVYIEQLTSNQQSLYVMEIKCWKCRQKLNIENKNLVQAPRIQEHRVGV